jgi:hypothetical protein
MPVFAGDLAGLLVSSIGIGSIALTPLWCDVAD